jgi:hypothetical protein
LLLVSVSACVLILHRVGFRHAVKGLGNNAPVAITYDAREAPFAQRVMSSESYATGEHVSIFPVCCL